MAKGCYVLDAPGVEPGRPPLRVHASEITFTRGRVQHSELSSAGRHGKEDGWILEYVVREET